MDVSSYLVLPLVVRFVIIKAYAILDAAIIIVIALPLLLLPPTSHS
jgi:hypothetical protein